MFALYLNSNTVTMRLIFIFLTIIFYSCTTRYQVKQSFKQDFFYDTNYIALRLPLFSQSYDLDEIMSQLSFKGYFELIGYKTSNQRPYYKITEQAVPFLLKEYYDSIREEHIGVFKYYRLDRIKLKDIQYKDKNHDTAEVTFKAQYKITSMFDFDPGPHNILVPTFKITNTVLYPKFTFVRSAKRWKSYSSIYLSSYIYLAPIIEKIPSLGTSLEYPDKLRQYRMEK